MTIDRNQTEGTVTVTVTAHEDADEDNEMLEIGLTNQVVQLADAKGVSVTVGMLEVTVEDNDGGNGGNGNGGG
ncbi:hypothetical protein [Candidatus Palauibacter sp.]|uniref:hypothetical protein n=1 Tax=Candidatus Palauibacter sp. TaxID=3101350 RepID=UPI003AF2B6C6